MRHKLSVTIPSYRQPEALTRALTALDAQTFRDFDVIIIDDHSGVDLAPITEQFSTSLDIKIVQNEKNLGAMKNMMKSITFPTDADYVFSHHEDDYIKSDYLEQAVALLESNPQLSFVLSSAVWVRSDEKFTVAMIEHPSCKIFTFHEFLGACLERIPFIFGSVVYRKKHLWGEFDLSTYHTLCDKIFLAELLRHNESSCAYISSPAVYVHDHGLDKKDNRSHGATVDHIINYFIYYKRHLPHSPYSNNLLTNGVLLAYSNLPGSKSFFKFIKQQRNYHLITLQNIRFVGIFALVSILCGAKITRHVMRMRRMRYFFKV